MTFKIVYTKLWGSPRPIAKKTDLMSVHSGALVVTFVNNLVYTYKCDNYLSLDFFPDLLFYTKIAFRFLEKETLGIAVLQSNGVTNIITVFKSYQHVSRTFLESN